MNGERLGAVDSAYLDIEEPRVPLHVASIATFEAGPLLDEHGHFRLAEVRDRVNRRLGLLPRLRQRVAFVPFGLARPVWIDDEQFDVAHHIDVVGLASPHDEAALLRLAEQIVMTPLDRTRPLWHLRFITGLEADRVALVERAHHAMVDGVSGVDVSVVLLDMAADAPADAPSDWRPAPAPTPLTLLIDGLVDRAAAPLSVVNRSVRALRRPGEVAKSVRDVAGALRTVGSSGVRAPRTSINKPVGATRRIVVVRQRLDAVRAAGADAGATVNDVVLTAVAGGMRALFLARGEALPSDREVKVLIPVSVRDASQSMSLGNRVGSLFAPLPIGIGDPVARLAAVMATTKALKESREANTSDALLQVADFLPPSVVHAIGRGVNHQPFVNSVVTNVPGPPFPLYALGARMLEAFPVVPLGGNMDFEIAVLSYDGALTIGVTADRATCPDIDAFVEGMECSFGELGAQWVPSLA